MAAVQSRARKSANRWDMPDPVYWVWKKLTSVKVAISLILLMALAAFISVVIPQVPPQFTDSSARIAKHVELQRGTWGFFTDVLAHAAFPASPLPMRRATIVGLDDGQHPRQRDAER